MLMINLRYGEKLIGKLDTWVVTSIFPQSLISLTLYVEYGCFPMGKQYGFRSAGISVPYDQDLHY